MWAPAAVTVSMFFVNIAFNALLVSTYGFTGAAYAQSASRIGQFLLLAGRAFTCTCVYLLPLAAERPPRRCAQGCFHLPL